jgi:hypothetical protein
MVGNEPFHTLCGIFDSLETGVVVKLFDIAFDPANYQNF